MRRHLAGVALVVALLGACGGDPALTPRASRSLTEKIDVVEFTIAAGEYEDARRGVDAIRQEAIRLAANDAISPARAPAIFEALGALEQSLAEVEADP